MASELVGDTPHATNQPTKKGYRRYPIRAFRTDKGWSFRVHLGAPFDISEEVIGHLEVLDEDSYELVLISKHVRNYLGNLARIIAISNESARRKDPT